MRVVVNFSKRQLFGKRKHAFYFIFFISSLFFFSGFKKKRKIYFGGREGEGESHKAKMFINFFIKKDLYNIHLMVLIIIYILYSDLDIALNTSLINLTLLAVLEK